MLERWRLATQVLLSMVVVFLCIHNVDARSLTFVSNLISTSAPGAIATHTIQFTVTQAVPPSGRIMLEAYDEAFWLQTGYGYTETSFEVATSGSYVARSIGSTADSSTDGLSPSGNTIWNIVLSSTSGIAAGSRVRLTLNQKTISPRNPTALGSHKIAIRTFNQFGAPLDDAFAVIVILQPVSVRVLQDPQPPVRLNGLPSGEIAAGSANAELSFITNEEATCRYATSPGIDYASMTNTFSSSGGTVFYTNVTGLANATSYAYYIRCLDTSGYVNTDDFIISFSLAADPISNTSVDPGGGVFLGSGGVGNIPNGSAVLYLADATLSGVGPPNSVVTILLDGVAYATAQTRDTGSFSKKVGGVERGTYTFNAYATDAVGRKTSSFSATIALESGTQNKISNIVLSPTVGIAPETVAENDTIELSGVAVPGNVVEVYITKQGGTVAAKDVAKYVATSTPQGAWSISIPPGTIKKGKYSLQARTVLNDQTVSSMSRLLVLNVGAGTSGDIGNRSDLNKDGKVNIIDFSILLSFWTTDDAVADINQDGVVNLADFSIMLFNWTG